MKLLKSDTLDVYKVYALSFVTIFAAWHIMATYVSPSVLFAPPIPVVRRLARMATTGVLFAHVGISLQRIFLGFALGSAVGIVVGLLMGNFRFVKNFLEPYVNFFRFIPGIAMITVAVIWFGIGEASKVFLIIYTTVFIVTLNTIAGALSVPRNKVRAAQCLGASKRQIFFHVSIPATLPYIFTGMRIAMANSFATIVSAEMLGASTGIGTIIWTARLFMMVEDVFVALIVLGLLGFLTDRVFSVLTVRYGGKYGTMA
jgi:NitT/TauT family transport system permease protein